MRHIFRHAVGIFFLFFFLLFLLATTLRFELLQTRFWTTAFEKSGVYEEMVTGVNTLQKQIDASPIKGRFQLKSVITKERLQEVVTGNIDRLIVYLHGTTKELRLFLPLNEWNLPPQVLNTPILKGLTKDTELASALKAFAVPPETANMIITTLATVQKILMWLPAVWLGLLAVVVGLGIGYFLLGTGPARFVGMGFLLTAAGLIEGLISVAGITITNLMMTQSSVQWPGWIRVLTTNLIEQFFAMGKTVGFLVSGIGFVLWIGSIALMKQGVLKEKSKVKEGLFKKIFHELAGVVLGVLILILTLAGIIYSMGGKLGLSITSNSSGASNQPTISIPKTGSGK